MNLENVFKYKLAQLRRKILFVYSRTVTTGFGRELQNMTANSRINRH